ncbi:hypothetical protein pb186bvf_011334 [Paramecium bursaria]
MKKTNLEQIVQLSMNKVVELQIQNEKLKLNQEDQDDKLKYFESMKLMLAHKDTGQTILMKKDQKLQRANILKQNAIKKMGSVDICFLVDVTSSMEPYKKQVQNCVSECMTNFFNITVKNLKFAVVAFQDFEEFKKLGNKYQQHDFTDNCEDIIGFLKEIKCQGGDDYCEDTRGGLRQMINSLTWTQDCYTYN